MRGTCGRRDDPFFSYDYPNKPEDPSEPASRDLYAEWSDGVVCQHCLLHDQALSPECRGLQTQKVNCFARSSRAPSEETAAFGVRQFCTEMARPKRFELLPPDS
jgi:hypothetical protein